MNSYTVGFFWAMCRSPRAWVSMAMESKDIRDAIGSPSHVPSSDPGRQATPEVADWVTRLEQELRRAQRRPSLPAHSLACSVVGHWSTSPGPRGRLVTLTNALLKRQ